jgi:hypothetical protein
VGVTVGVAVGNTGPISASVAVGLGEGVAVGNEGPTGGSVAANVGGGSGDGLGEGVALGSGRGVQVGQGVGVGWTGSGRATMTRLITMLPTMSRLMSQNRVWLRLRGRRRRLLTLL